MSQTVVKNISLLVTNNPSLGKTELGLIENAALLIEDGKISWVGAGESAPTGEKTIDAAGKAVIPGFVDSHNHLIFAKDRAAEFSARMKGEPYSAGGIVAALSIRVGGDELDQSIINWVKREFSLLLGERTAEEIKMAIGSAFPLPGEPDAEIRGRDLATGLPKTILVTSADIRKALEEPVSAIVNAVKNTLDKTPPELASDLMDRGIVLTGGGALLRGLDERLRHETGMPIHISERPLQAVAEGSGKCIEEFEALEKVLISEPRR